MQTLAVFFQRGGDSPAYFILEGEYMKKALIIGLGDILKGDFGVGCYIIEALEQEQLGDSIHLAYLADDPRYAGGCSTRWTLL